MQYEVVYSEVYEELQQREFTCLIDGFDERFASQEELDNLFKTNEHQIKHFPKANFVFLFRTDSADKAQFVPPPRLGQLQQLILRPFTPQQSTLILEISVITL